MVGCQIPLRLYTSYIYEHISALHRLFTHDNRRMTTLRVDVLSLITYPICSVVFYFNLNYTIASLLCSAAAICSSYYDWHVLSLEAPALYKSAIRNFFYAVLYLFVLSVYPPHTFRWWTGLVGFLLCMIKIAETIAPPKNVPFT